MIKGGLSERKCSNCHKNQIELEYNCGYLVDELTCNKSVTFEFPECEDVDFFSYICPIWYYNEYNHFYSLLALYKESKTDLVLSPFGLRYSVKCSETYLNQLKLSKTTK